MIKLIAETAWHHEGDFNFMKKLLNDISKEESVDIVKIHVTIDFDSYMTTDNDLYVNLKKWLFTKEQWSELIHIIKDNKKELMILCNDIKAIEFSSSFDPDYVELHALCLNVPNLQEKIKEIIGIKTKVVIGIGGCTLDEINHAIERFEDRKIILMTGFQNYPTRYKDVNLNKIIKVQKLYKNLEVGYADHTAWNEANNELITLLVAANGMRFIEKHVTNVYGENRCDSSAAISIEMLKSLKLKLNLLKLIYGDGSFDLNDGEKSYASIKMLGVAAKDLKLGDKITLDNINFIRTPQKSDLDQISLINKFGEKIVQDVKKDKVIKKCHFK